MGEAVIKVRIPKTIKLKKREYDLEDLIREYRKYRAEKEILKIRGILKGLDINKEEYKRGKYRDL